MKLNLISRAHCPACGNEINNQMLYPLEQFKVFQCPCGLKFIDPSLDERSMSEIYQSSETLKEINPALGHYYEYDTLSPNSQTIKDYSRTLDELGKLTRGRELLEGGCGTGSFLQFAKGKGWNVHGVDSSAENIQKLGEQGIAGDAAGFLDFAAPHPFDVVALWDLIEHPQNPLAFVEKSRELLKKDGLLFIATPCDPSLLSILAYGMYQLSGGRINFPIKKLYTIEHTSYFNLKALSRLLKSGGFRIERAWKTESDLARYSLSFPLKTVLRVLFILARPLGLKNRLLVIARKN